MSGFTGDIDNANGDNSVLKKVSVSESVAKGLTGCTTSQRRLMFVIEALTVGGAEQVVVDLANEFVLRGDVVHVVCLSAIGALADRLSPDVSLHLLNKRPGVDLSIPRRLRRLATRNSIEVVNSHLWTANLWARIALFGSGIPIVATEHNRDIWKRLHHRVIDRILSHSTTRLIAVSEDTASFYQDDVGVDSKLITVINNGVDTQLYARGNGQALRNTLAAADEFLIGTVGRLTEAKNHIRLVETAAILRETDLPVRIVIVGDGPCREAIESRIEELNVADCMTLLGERSDVPDLLAAFDVFVLSSDREGHPLSALEAQAAGTPVVLTDAGGSADAVSRSDQGFGGVLVERDASALAQCLGQLATEPEKLAAMSSFARTHAAQNYDKKIMIDRYSTIFSSIKLP